jgi:hypothetical protein
MHDVLESNLRGGPLVEVPPVGRHGSAMNCSKSVQPYVSAEGTRQWWLNGRLHREDGPALETKEGDRVWYHAGLFHRADGPAFEMANGDRLWFARGVVHRVDGPAVERSDGLRMWYLNGELHREDGPAVESSDGGREWHLGGRLQCKESVVPRILARVVEEMVSRGELSTAETPTVARVQLKELGADAVRRYHELASSERGLGR